MFVKKYRGLRPKPGGIRPHKPFTSARVRFQSSRYPDTVENGSISSACTIVQKPNPVECVAVHEAVTLTCGDKPAAAGAAYPTASALAQAAAEALSYVFGSCVADDGSYTCADDSTKIEENMNAIGSVRL